MVEEIDNYSLKKEGEERIKKILEDWFVIASEIFQKPVYRIDDDRGYSFEPHYDIHFELPNEHHSASSDLLEKTDARQDTEKYNSIVDRVNIFSGYHHAAYLAPLDFSITAYCPEIYQDARKLAVKLEKRLKIDVSLKIMYPRV